MKNFLKQFKVSGIESPRPSSVGGECSRSDVECGDGCGGSNDCIDGCSDGC